MGSVGRRVEHPLPATDTDEHLPINGWGADRDRDHGPMINWGQTYLPETGTRVPPAVAQTWLVCVPRSNSLWQRQRRLSPPRGAEPGNAAFCLPGICNAKKSHDRSALVRWFGLQLCGEFANPADHKPQGNALKTTRLTKAKSSLQAMNLWVVR